MVGVTTLVVVINGTAGDFLWSEQIRMLNQQRREDEPAVHDPCLREGR
jgi:hypothetical protein